MTLLESIKNAFNKKEQKQPNTKIVDNVIDNYEDISFFDTMFDDSFGFGIEKIKKQKDLIKHYREVSLYPDVNNAINIIIDEASFNPYNEKKLFSLNFSDNISDTSKNIYIDVFNDVISKLDIKDNLYSLMKQFYIDGQLNILLDYEEKEGITKFYVLSPYGLYFDKKKNKWSYDETYTDDEVFTYFSNNGRINFDKNEFVRIDSGIYNKKLILGYLHNVTKIANQMTNLEDMLVLMRYNRSVSRRIFNVDVGDTNYKKAMEIIKKIQEKFKYKKYYDPETGEIKNQIKKVSLVEDYWFANRGGEGNKGTSVTTLDERGSLGDIEDILYFRRKLYNALHIPISRIGDGKDISLDIDFENSSTNVENINFYNYVSRFKNRFIKIIYDIFIKELLIKGIIKEEEQIFILKNIEIKYSNDNIFYENMRKEKLRKEFEIWESIQDNIGKTISFKTAYKTIFNKTDEDIENLKKEIMEEKQDEFFKQFYENNEDY